MVEMIEMTEVNEAAMLEDAVRVLLRSTTLPLSFQADFPVGAAPQWATPLVVTSEKTGREFMLEVKAVECTDWRSER